MLTDSEREWLNDREIFLAGLGCYVWDGYYWDEGSPFEDMKEAAEFEARVVAKLAKGIPQSAWLAEAEKCDMPPSWSRVKLARLQVEEEMNADR